nr:hypothetical protein [Streptomyces triticisoli]
MSEQQEPRRVRGRRRWAGGFGFTVGFLGTIGFFAFFPGLPHVIDWGALLVSVAVGALGRWVCRAWVNGGREQKVSRVRR